MSCCGVFTCMFHAFRNDVATVLKIYAAICVDLSHNFGRMLQKHDKFVSAIVLICCSRNFLLAQQAFWGVALDDLYVAGSVCIVSSIYFHRCMVPSRKYCGNYLLMLCLVTRAVAKVFYLIFFFFLIFAAGEPELVPYTLYVSWHAIILSRMMCGMRRNVMNNRSGRRGWDGGWYVQVQEACCMQHPALLLAAPVFFFLFVSYRFRCDKSSSGSIGEFSTWKYVARVAWLVSRLKIPSCYLLPYCVAVVIWTRC